jgi:chloramphenicol 3-O-phosphotransferase
LLGDAMAAVPAVARDRRAIVLAGPPGAGKSTVLAETLAGHRPEWLIVDADEFKIGLLRAALADHSYEGFIKPAVVRDLELGGEIFLPLELAPLVHDESSALAVALRDEAVEQGMNVVIDSVLWNIPAAIELGRRLDEAGYEIDVVDVEVSYELSQRRTAARWREARSAYAGGLGGRWVPSEYSRAVFSEVSGRALSQTAAERLAETCPAVIRLRRFWTPTENAPTRLEIERTRNRRGAPLLPRHD